MPEKNTFHRLKEAKEGYYINKDKHSKNITLDARFRRRSTVVVEMLQDCSVSRKTQQDLWRKTMEKESGAGMIFEGQKQELS